MAPTAQYRSVIAPQIFELDIYWCQL